MARQSFPTCRLNKLIDKRIIWRYKTDHPARIEHLILLKLVFGCLCFGVCGINRGFSVKEVTCRFLSRTDRFIKMGSTASSDDELRTYSQI